MSILGQIPSLTIIVPDNKVSVFLSIKYLFTQLIIQWGEEEETENKIKDLSVSGKHDKHLTNAKKCNMQG